ncbi:MAG TPA: porin family protein [Vicinamibacterales bacterium]|nr:porin family protein [Vicinamibacterales bacterium]
MSTRRLVIAGAVVASIAALPLPVFAQEGGLKAGLNLASWSEQDPEEGVELSRRTGLVAGGWLRTPERSRVSFQIEALYSEKGASLTVDMFDEIDAEVRLRYVEVPLLARVDFAPAGSAGRFHLFGGVAPAFRISARASGSDGTNESSADVGDSFETFDLGAVAGAGLEFGRAVIDARYTHGLRSIAKAEAADIEVPTVKNRAFSVMVGFRLF